MKKLLSQQLSKLRGAPKIVKLNVGCGTDYKPGWVNIDNNSDHNITDGKLDLNWDLLQPLPYKDHSVDFIFNEHFLEHFSVEEGQAVLKDFKRLLKPGGVLRIAMPDLRVAVDLYNDKDWKSRPLIKIHDLGFVQTPAELLNMSMRFWGHKWVYDWEELERRLKTAGFTNFYRCELRQSKFPELRDLETRDGSTLIAEVQA